MSLVVQSKYRLYLIISLLIYISPVSVLGQMNVYRIKKNNKRMYSYRGGKNPFIWKYNSIGLSLNALNYYGDLAPTPKKVSTDLALTKPGVGLYFVQRKGPRYSLITSLTYGAIKGSDNVSADKSDTNNGIYRYQRNLSFRNRIEELSVTTVFDIIENHAPYTHRPTWTAYVFSGLAFYHHNPQAQIPAKDLNGNKLPHSGEWVNLISLGTEGQHANLHKDDANYGVKPYNLFQIAVPFGIGARYRLNDNLDFWTEFSFRYLFTDYIDDVSGNYVDMGVFGNNELAKALSYRTNEVASPNHTYISKYDGKTYRVVSGYGEESKENLRGNKKNKDIYTVFSFKISYILKPGFTRPKTR